MRFSAPWVVATMSDCEWACEWDTTIPSKNRLCINHLCWDATGNDLCPIGRVLDLCDRQEYYALDVAPEYASNVYIPVNAVRHILDGERDE